MNHSIVTLALGRIFRMAARPTQPGDIAEYERCRRLILDELDPLDQRQSREPRCWAADRLLGASGD